jgi:hypothetical protein
MDLTRIDTIVQFTQGTAVWNNINVPVPAGAIVIDTTNKVVKEGDGSTLFDNLPVCLDYNFHASTSGAIVPEGDDVGDIAIADDTMYSTGVSKLEDILTDIVNKSNTNTTQNDRIASLTTEGNFIAEVSEGIVDGTIVICQSGQYVPGDKTLTQLIADLVIQANVAQTGMHIDDLEWYSDSGLTQKVVKPNQISENNTYWCKVTGFHDNAELRCVSFNMTTANANVTITSDTPSATGSLKLITNAYSSADTDEFRATATDSFGNTFAVGMTTIAGNSDALIVKFDSDFNVVARKLYSGAYANNFNSVIVDTSDNIIAVGKYITQAGGYTEAFIVKFSNNLNTIIAHKTYGSSGDDTFNDIAIGPSGNFYVVGYTTSEGLGLKEGLIVKFNSSLSILYKKRYGGTGNDVFNGVTMDTNGNAICVGYTSSEGANTSGLILKLDSNLNVVLRKYYNSTLGTTTEFNAVAVTAANIAYVVGRVVIASGNKGLLVKFDSSLNSTGSKLYGNTVGSTELTGVALDGDVNIIVAGKTSAEGAGNYDALVMKFGSALSIIGRKTYGTVGEDSNIDCSVDGSNNIILSGYSVISGSTDGIITKIPGSLPSGTYTNKYLTDLILSDSKLTLSDDSATVISSTLSMVDSALTLTNGAMSLSNASGGIIKDVTIMDAISNVFQVQIGEVVSAENSSLSFDVTTDDGDSIVSKTMSVIVEGTNVLELIYGSTYQDAFSGVTINSEGNIYAVGASFGSSYSQCIIVKFDSSLNIVIQKAYATTYNDAFNKIAIDQSGNIFVVGYESSSSTKSKALIIKFDSDLNKLAAKIYGTTGYSEYFNDIVIDSSNNIIVVGGTNYEGTTEDCLIIKFNSSLSILARKIYGGSNHDYFNAVTVDSSDNIYAVGYTLSEGSGLSDAIIVKFDSSLNKLAGKRYGLANNDYYNGVAVDSSDNIYAVGYGYDTVGSVNGIITKFDSSLNVLIKKYYGGTDSDSFASIEIDKDDNIYVVGNTYSVAGSYAEGLLVKFDTSLVLINDKICGGTNHDWFYDVVLDANKNIICVGTSQYTGSSTDTYSYIVKIPDSIPSGTFSGTTLTNLFIKDISLTLSTTTATVADSTLTLADSTDTIGNSLATLSTVSLTSQKDVIIL